MLSSRLRLAAASAERLVQNTHVGTYEDTIRNLRINDQTRVIYQGFTGGVATKNAQDTIAYGTKVVGGVTKDPRANTHLDLPLFGSMKKAAEELRPDVSAVFVRGSLAAEAIIDAIKAEVPLIVSVAEHVPIHDMLRVHEVLRTQSKSRLVGPNCPGIIAPEQCRVGIMPYKQYTRGCVGIVSKSGTLSYEAVGSTSRAGLGQSLVVGMGGDMIPGTTLADALKLFFEHDETKGIIVIGEIGGEAELEAADLIQNYRKNTSKPKPIIAMVAGQTSPQDKIMGHAGAIYRAGVDPTAREKAAALQKAGAVVVPHPGVMGSIMEKLLASYQSGNFEYMKQPKKTGSIDVEAMIKKDRLGIYD
ncbi:succinate- ligase [Fusarium sporotrichioides]|uniref:Succinate-ligase n=1 Tax=Fusarium sporotrichioides TaxID=5514 RepID=A0A395SP04_FUSSP|nr:succinate- ligase [Fusarium sporotrichioides]